jgi:hypothetical protein
MSKEDVKEQVYPRIHGLVFDPSSGLLKYLPVDFGRRVGSLDHIYGLYDYKKGKKPLPSTSSRPFSTSSSSSASSCTTTVYSNDKKDENL